MHFAVGMHHGHSIAPPLKQHLDPLRWHRFEAWIDYRTVLIPGRPYRESVAYTFIAYVCGFPERCLAAIAQSPVLQLSDQYRQVPSGILQTKAAMPAILQLLIQNLTGCRAVGLTPLKISTVMTYSMFASRAETGSAFFLFTSLLYAALSFPHMVLHHLGLFKSRL